MSFWTTTYYNERGEELTTEQVIEEDYEELRSTRQHDGCGGLVFISAAGTLREAKCRSCGAKWRDTFTETGWVRLEAYGGKPR